MASLRSLDAWRLSRKLAIRCYRATMTRPLSQHFDLVDQIRRSAVSIPSNIAEGYGLGTRPQLIRFLRISLGSAHELSTQLDICRELRLLRGADADVLIELVTTVIKVLVGLLKALGARTPSH